MTEKRRALLSVSDKRGIDELARELSALGFEIISTGGTAGALVAAGVTVTAVSEVTGFPEILGGRVKTLHPLVHGAILADLRRGEQAEEIKRHGIKPIELVVVNLYPFEKTVAREGTALGEAVENIDIGGPAMVRAAAKNHASVAVVVNPDRYPALVEELKREGRIGPDTRFSLAAEAFAHTAAYDAAIAAYLGDRPGGGANELFPETLALTFHRRQVLRYGENPQQKAAFYSSSRLAGGLAGAEQLQGRELSFNNLNDLQAACELVLEFDRPAAVAVKHAGPCGVGLADGPAQAYRLARDADPVSVFGGVIALNRTVDEEAALEMGKIFLEVIAAPGFSPEARGVLEAKKDLRLLRIDHIGSEGDRFDWKKVAGGLLVQTVDREAVEVERGRVVTERSPTAAEWTALNFAQAVVKHARSNAIVVARAERTCGIGAGQASRIGAARIALEQAGPEARGAVLGSDAFFPFPDTVEEAARAGITAIVQPGGSLKDEESIKICNLKGLAMVFTGRRYFRH